MARYSALAAAAAFFLAIGSAQAADAQASNPLVIGEDAVAARNICDDASALRRIKSRFAYAERATWHRGFTIAALENPRPSGHPYAKPGVVPRDFCTADATMTTGAPYRVFYVIEHGLGFAGIGASVDFCVLGLDPWHVHDGDCRTVR